MPIAEEKKTWKGTYDTSNVRSGLEQEYFALLKLPQNFFKNGSKEQHESIKFNPEANWMIIRVAIEVYRPIQPDAGPPLMAAFSLLFFLTKPQFHNENLFPAITPQMKVRLLALTKKDFLTSAMLLMKNEPLKFPLVVYSIRS